MSESTDQQVVDTQVATQEPEGPSIDIEFPQLTPEPQSEPVSEQRTEIEKPTELEPSPESTTQPSEDEEKKAHGVAAGRKGFLMEENKRLDEQLEAKRAELAQMNQTATAPQQDHDAIAENAQKLVTEGGVDPAIALMKAKGLANQQAQQTQQQQQTQQTERNALDNMRVDLEVLKVQQEEPEFSLQDPLAQQLMREDPGLPLTRLVKNWKAERILQGATAATATSQTQTVQPDPMTVDSPGPRQASPVPASAVKILPDGTTDMVDGIAVTETERSLWNNNGSAFVGTVPGVKNFETFVRHSRGE